MLTVVLLDVILLVTLLILRVPLPFTFGGALLFMSVFGDISMKSMMLWAFGQITSPVLLASPLFILAGTLMSGSGIARRLLDFVDSFIGRVKGGLGAISVLTCALIGAISGSGFTGVAATGPVIIPRMVAQGYPRGYATALVSVSSILGLLIPPSVIMILYGWITETSILAAFLSTVGPGIMIVISLIVVNFVWARKFNLILEPKMAPADKRKQITSRTRLALPSLLMPVIILGGIYGGVFTPTEAAAVAAIYAIVLGIAIHKELNWKSLYGTSLEAVTSIGAIMTMILFTLMLSQTYVMAKVPQSLIELFFGFTDNRILMLIIINLFLFIVGMIVNDMTGMLLVAPLLLPLVRELGIDPIHFAAIMGVNLAMGGVTPPYASILYLGMRVGKAQFNEMLKPTLVFLAFGYVPVVFLTTFWPNLALFLPRLFGFLD